MLWLANNTKCVRCTDGGAGRSSIRVPYYHNETIFNGKCERRISCEKVSLSVEGTTRYDRSRYKIKSLPVKRLQPKIYISVDDACLSSSRFFCLFEFIISIVLPKRCQSTVFVPNDLVTAYNSYSCSKRSLAHGTRTCSFLIYAISRTLFASFEAIILFTAPNEIPRTQNEFRVKRARNCHRICIIKI